MARFPNLAVIGGSGSSGTTLLAHLLNRHPDVISGPELNFFNHHEILNLPILQTVYPRLLADRCPIDGYHELSGFLRHRSYFGINRNHFESWVRSSRDPASLIKHLCDHVLAHSGKSFFIEKTPTNIYNFKILAELDPVFSLIHVIRDGRDVTFSLMKRGWSLFQAGSRWLYDTLSGLSARGSEGYLEIRYEELVSEPSLSLGIIFDHLGLPFDEDIFHEILTAPQQDWWETNDPVRVWGQTPRDPISTASIGKYKTSINESMLSTFSRIHLTNYALGKLNTPVRSFQGLLDLLDYEHSDNYSQIESDLKLRLRERYYEIQDYLRRIPKSLRKTNKFPQVLTRIATK